MTTMIEKNPSLDLLDTQIANRYNIFCAEVAQVVEQRTENPRVTSPTLVLGTTYLYKMRK